MNKVGWKWGKTRWGDGERKTLNVYCVGFSGGFAILKDNKSSAPWVLLLPDDWRERIPDYASRRQIPARYAPQTTKEAIAVIRLTVGIAAAVRFAGVS